MSFGAFVGAGFQVAAGCVAAFGVNLVAAKWAIGPFKGNARFYERHRLNYLDTVPASVGPSPPSSMNVSNHTPSLYRYSD